MKMKHLAAVVIILATSQLTGCGGGSDTPLIPAATPEMKGLWEDPANTPSNATKAIVLANGDTWLLFLESGASTRFAQLKLETNGTTFSTATGSGNHYHILTNSRESATANGTFTTKGSINGTLSSGAPVVMTPLTLTYNTTRSVSVASLADAVGTWKGIYNRGAIISTVTVAATTGAISGSSTTDCSYSGMLTPRITDPAFFDISFTESCPKVGGGTTDVTQSGIALLNEAKTTLSVAMTSADKTGGAMFVGVKQ